MTKSNVDEAISILEIYNLKIFDIVELKTKEHFKYFTCVTTHRVNRKDRSKLFLLGFRPYLLWNGLYYWGFPK